MLKKLKLIVLVLSIILICGCSSYNGVESVKVSDPLTENEIINYVQNEIYKECGDETTVKIIDKKELTICTSWFMSGCEKYQTVENGYLYKVEIANKSSEIIGTGTYKDGYALYDKRFTNGKSERTSSFESNYKTQKQTYLIKNEFINILNEKYNKYYIYKNKNDKYDYDIFINSSNYDDIKDLILKLNNAIEKNSDSSSIYTFDYYLFIYKDENAFNNINLDLYKNGYEGNNTIKDMIEQYTGKEVISLGRCGGFDYIFFTNNGNSENNVDKKYIDNDIDYNAFEYFVFYYDGSPYVLHNSTLRVFGVK